jgi:hypothetical protein
VPHVGGLVLGQAEEAQAAEDQAPYPGAVLADAAGEHQRVEPTQAHH